MFFRNKTFLKLFLKLIIRKLFYFIFTLANASGIAKYPLCWQLYTNYKNNRDNYRENDTCQNIQIGFETTIMKHF